MTACGKITATLEQVGLTSTGILLDCLCLHIGFLFYDESMINMSDFVETKKFLKGVAYKTDNSELNSCCPCSSNSYFQGESISAVLDDEIS